MHESQDPTDPTTGNDVIELHQNDETPADNAAAKEAAIAATVALRCDSCGRRSIPKEVSVRLKSTNGPAAFDTHGGIYRIPIFCDECLTALLILVRRTAGVIRPESDIATVVMAH